jgi:hypothetical protein
MYFPQNRGFGSALSNFRISGGGGVWTPQPPRYATALYSDICKPESQPTQQQHTITELFYVTNSSAWLMLLTLILLTWRIWWAPNNASKWQMGFNSTFKVLMYELKHDRAIFLQWHIRPPSGPRSPHYRGFTVTLRHTTLGKTPLDDWSARRRDLYLTTNNTHSRQIFMPSAGFEPAIPASELPKTHVLDRAATRTGCKIFSSFGETTPSGPGPPHSQGF